MINMGEVLSELLLYIHSLFFSSFFRVVIC